MMFRDIKRLRDANGIEEKPGKTIKAFEITAGRQQKTKSTIKAFENK